MAGWRRSELKAGVYDEIVSARLDRQLAVLGAPFEVYRSALTVSEPIGAVLESLLGDGLALALAELKADSAKGLALAEALLAVLHPHAPRVFERDDELRLNAERLTAIVARPAQAPERSRGSLHASSLIVNAEGDQLLEHLRSEFDSADSVDLLCAFIKLSGFEKFRTEIERHCDGRGRSLRVLTTTYMSASDAGARWVLDAKYTREYGDESRMDRFQMCAYAVAFDADRVSLVYPTGSSTGPVRDLLHATIGNRTLCIDSLALPMAAGPETCRAALAAVEYFPYSSRADAPPHADTRTIPTRQL